MKALKIILFALLCGTTSLMAQDQQLIDTELKGTLAQTLQKMGYELIFAKSDNSLEFKHEDVYYWYTIARLNNNTLVLTLNRKVLESDENNPVQIGPALKACNEVNLSQLYFKMYHKERMIEGKRVDAFYLIHQVFLKSCSELTPEIIKADIKEMGEASELFKVAYTAFAYASSTTEADLLYEQYRAKIKETEKQIAQDQQLIDTELKGTLAQTLQEMGFDLKFAQSDNSLNIYIRDVNYWFNIARSDNNTLVLTLNRKVLESDENNPVQIGPALRACNEVNRMQSYFKMFHKEKMDEGKSVDAFYLIHQVFLKSCSELTPQAIKNDIKGMDEASRQFMAAYGTFKAVAEQAVQLEKENVRKLIEANKKAEEEKQEDAIYITDTPPAKLTLIDMKVCSVDAKDKELSKADTSVKLEDAKYICPVITVNAGEPGIYDIKVKIYNDKNKILLYHNQMFTIETPIEVKRAGKDFEYTLDKFGTNDGKMWTKGTYKVELFIEEEGEIKELGTKTFEIR